MTGTTLSHYQIEAELGRGGMGIVYRARDTKLDRTVAIKVLPAAALTSEDDRTRFYREAKAAAALNHPNIAQIYQIDEAVPSNAPHGTQPSPFIAMEYIDGQTLEDRIKSGPIKLDTVVALALDLADALAAAHAKDIVHRDIKSANIMLTSSGTAKILDFGLALTAQSTKLTRMGSTLGTVAYMSPEQAHGDEVDHRTDLWALGVVMYEMVVGANPFGGDYEQAVVYSILNEDPEPVTGLRTGVPMELEQLIDKCLRKDAAHRYQSAADLKADLAALSLPSRSSRTTRLATPKAAAAPRSLNPATIGMLVAAVLLSAVASWWVFSGAETPTPETGDIVRSTILLPEDRPLAFDAYDAVGLEMSMLDVSRDGRYLVYCSFTDQDRANVILVLREVQSGESRVLSGTEGAYFPVFSPDGTWIAYFAKDAVYRVPREGGRPRFVASTSDPTGLLWHNDGFIYWPNLQGNTLMRATPEGQVETGEHESRCNCGMPTIGPDGTGFVVSGRDGEEKVDWWQWGDGPQEMDLPGNHVRFLDSRTAVFTRTGSLFGAALDAGTGRMSGDEVLLLDDMRTASIYRSGHYAISEGGTLFYAAGAPSGQVDIIIRSADGTEEEVGLPTGVYGPLDVSPDGRFIIIRSLDQGGQYLLLDRQSGGTQIVLRADDALNVIWSSDVNSIIYARMEDGQSAIIQRDLDTGMERVLFDVEGVAWPSNVSPDGKYLAYRVNDKRLSKLLIRNLEEGTEEVVNREEGTTYWAADWSRDGRFFTYTKVAEGGSQIHVEPFPRNGTYKLISPGGGEESEMLPDEDALIYRDGRNWMKVRYGSDIDSFSEPERVFSGPYVNVAGMEFRVMDDGDVLLQRAVNTSLSTDRIAVITGFDDLVRHRLGAKE